jgi:prevent-host-death family protein
MKSVGSYYAKSHFAQLLREVEQSHESIAITHHNRTVACVSPYVSEEQSVSASVAAIARLRTIRDSSRGTGSVVELRDEGRTR